VYTGTSFFLGVVAAAHARPNFGHEHPSPASPSAGQWRMASLFSGSLPVLLLCLGPGGGRVQWFYKSFPPLPPTLHRAVHTCLMILRLSIPRCRFCRGLILGFGYPDIKGGLEGCNIHRSTASHPNAICSALWLYALNLSSIRQRNLP